MNADHDDSKEYFDEEGIPPYLSRVVEMPSAFTIYMGIAKLQAKQAVRRSLRALGINNPKRLELQDIEPPDTEAAKRAFQLCREFSNDILFNHCMRAFYFASAIFSHEKILSKIDLEAAAVAVAFHDYGLTEQGRQNKERLKSESFEVRGAKHCYQHAIHDFRFDPGKAELIYEAIRLHTSMSRAIQTSLMCKFVNFGSVCDVIGYHIEDVHARTKLDILQKFPRLGWKKNVVKLFREEFEISISPMMKFTHDYLFLKFFVDHSPYAD